MIARVLCFLALVACASAVSVDMPSNSMNFYDVDLSDREVVPDVSAKNTFQKSSLLDRKDVMEDMPALNEITNLLELQSGTAKAKNATVIMKLVSNLRNSILAQRLQAEKELNKTRTRFREREEQRRVNQEHEDKEVDKIRAAFEKAQNARDREDSQEINDLNQRMKKFEDRQEERNAEAAQQEQTLKELLDAYRERTSQRKRLLELIETLRGLVKALDSSDKGAKAAEKKLAA